MATFYGYNGQAGTGKTTEIIKKLNECLNEKGMLKHHSVLAMTFMHGSRRRLAERLSQIKKTKKVKINCSTIDAFCTRIVQRFRLYLHLKKPIEVFVTNYDDDEQEYLLEDNRCIHVNIAFLRKAFIELMKFASVQNFISNSYPIIIIDEFQDCKGLLLNVIQSFASCKCILIVAGDEFQQLDDKANCDALDWLKTVCKLSELKQIHRTRNSRILNSAAGLRTQSKISNSILVRPATSAALAAWMITSSIQWYEWGKNKSIALLYPTSPGSSQFIAATLDRLKSPFINEKRSLDACPFTYYVDKEENVDSILSRITSYTLQKSLNLEFICSLESIEDPVLQRCIKRAKKILFLRGEVEMSKSEFEVILKKELHLINTYVTTNEKGKRISLTIHAAKNREFDDVIILWPYAVIKNELQQRKLLYNAITRAKRNVFIIVQVRKREDVFKSSTLALFDNIEQPKQKNKKKAAG